MSAKTTHQGKGTTTVTRKQKVSVVKLAERDQAAAVAAGLPAEATLACW